MINVQWTKKWIGLASAFALTLTAAGCGSGGSASSSGTPIGTEELPALYKGTYQNPPSTAPAHKPGKSIYLISCGQSIPFCVTAITGAKDASEALGWDTTLIDSKGEFNAAGQGVRQAIAADADGIFIYSMDCEYLKQPLQEAKEAGIPVVTAEARDCNQDLQFKTTDGPHLYTSVVGYTEGELVDWLGAYGEAQAKFVLAKAGDEAKSMSFFYSELGTSLVIQDRYSKYLASECSKCTDEPVGFTFAEAASGLQQKAQQALLKAPGVNAIRVDSDGSLTGGVLPAVQDRAPDAMIVAGEGQSAVLDIIREGDTKIAGGVGTATTWEGWAAIDALLRTFAGEPVAPSGIGIQVWDEDHNVPAKGGYEPPIDFAAKYKQAWNVE